MSDEPTLDDLIAAMRLAIEAAADSEAARNVVVELLAMAPASEGRRTQPVHLLVDAIQAAGARFEVCS
jgi:hypothetical protein